MKKGSSEMNETIEGKLKAMNEFLVGKKAERDLLINQKVSQLEEVSKLESVNETILLQKMILDEASVKARENGKQILSDTATQSVQMVMEQDINVDIEFETLRGQSSAGLIVNKTASDGTIVTTNPAEDDGGGVGDLVALSTFFAFGLLNGENNQAPFFLDEPTKFVSKGYSNNVAKFIKEMVGYVGKQTFMVTHDETVAQSGDKIFRVSMNEQLESVVEQEVL